MRNAEDIEGYFLELELPYERLDDGMWVVMHQEDSLDNLVVYLAGSAVSFRVKLAELEGDNVALMRRLLELNATEMVHGAYGLEEDAIVITDSLELENLDINEFQATIDAIGLAITTHYPVLSGLIRQDAGENAG